MNNVRTSKKRDAMLALLRRSHCHPSADWVYRELKAGGGGGRPGTL